MLLMTRDEDVFRSINTANLSVNEIRNILGTDERIGFSSYVVIKPHYFGFASTSLSPKFDVFSTLVNEILSRTDNGNLNFCISPFVKHATREEAVSMDYIGKTTIEIASDNSLAGHFLNFITGNSDCDELESLEITIKPKRGRNIKPVVESVMSKTSDEGLKKLIIKAKNDASSAMLDLYVVGRGAISDTLGSVNDASIASAIEEKISRNLNLQDKIREHLENGQMDQADFSRILRYCDERAWTDFVDSLQVDYRLQQ